MRIIQVLAVIGFGISAWLYGMKLAGKISSVVGCGGEGGCANVLGSQWSQWFGIPVSVVSAVFYLAILVLTFKRSKTLLTAAAFLLIAAALWFMGLQIFVIKDFCPWCFVTHLVGVATALAILWKARAPINPARLGIPVVMILGLALGQVYGPEPETHALTDEGAEGGFNEQQEATEQNAGEERQVTFPGPDGQVRSFRIGSVPLLGSPEARHVMVKYFDYTCGSCRDMEGDLTALMKAYPDEVAVIVLPTPLNRACNPYLSAGIEDHKNACELARLGLASWRAQPESFAGAHELLFSRPVHTPESARAALEKIVSPEKLASALKDPWVEESLQANLRDYQALSGRNIKMPKLRLREGQTMHGVARSTEIFVELVEKILSLN